MTREPEFCPRDVVALLAIDQFDSEMGSHGIPMPEATARENQFAFAAEPYIDFAAKAIGEADEARRKTYPNESHHGVTYRVKKLDKSLPDGG